MRTLESLMSLEGRVALVTGGAGHLGGAVVEALLERGAIVALSDLEPDVCAKRVDELERFSQAGRLAWLEADLSDHAATRSLVRRCIERHGALDVLFHCAAYVGTTSVPGWSAPLAEQTVEAWDAGLRVNLTAAFVLAQEAALALARSGHGSVVFMGSIYGVVGPNLSLYEGTKMQNPAAYGASKGGLLQLVRYLATTMAPRVRVNALSPGGVWRDHPKEFHERYRDRTPLGRMATEEDIKGAAAFLASDLSAYVTGHNLAVDGGWTAW